MVNGAKPDWPLDFVKGRTNEMVWVWEQENDLGDLEPVDLTGASARFVMKADLDDAEPAVDVGTGSGGEIAIDELAGKITLTLPGEATADLDIPASGTNHAPRFKPFSFELIVTMANGNDYTLRIGIVRLYQGVL